MEGWELEGNVPWPFIEVDESSYRVHGLRAAQLMLVRWPDDAQLSITGHKDPYGHTRINCAINGPYD